MKTIAKVIGGIDPTLLNLNKKRSQIGPTSRYIFTHFGCSDQSRFGKAKRQHGSPGNINNGWQNRKDPTIYKTDYVVILFFVY